MAFPFGRKQIPSARLDHTADYGAGRRTGRTRAAGRRVHFEALEPRLLLSSDLAYLALASADLTLRVEEVGGVETLQLVDSNQPQAVLAAEALSDIDGSSGYGVRIEGNGFDIRLTLDDSLDTTTIAGGILFDGGGGEGTLTGRNLSNAWTITGAGEGHIGDLHFSGVENLIGGSRSDGFYFAPEGRITGLIEGGGGNDVVWATLLGFAGGTDPAAGTGTAGDPDAPARVENIWRITGADAGTFNDQAFSGIESLVGNRLADRFEFSDGGSLSGRIAGGTGFDVITGADVDNTWTIDAMNAGMFNDASFSGIEELRGGAAADLFAIERGGRLSGLIVGGGGSDTLAGSDTLNLWQITGSNVGRFNEQVFTGIESLIGGGGRDDFVFADGAGLQGAIDGGGGLNALDLSAYATDVTVDLGAGAASVTGGIANIQHVAGGSGFDTLIGPTADATWTITGADTGDVNGATFTSIENLTGAADNEDTFVLLPGARVSGVLEGGAAGYDSMAIRGGSYQTVGFTATGPDSGTVSLDGVIISYAGLEPIDIDPDSAPGTVDITANELWADDLVLEQDPDDPTKTRLRSLNDSTESVTFDNPDFWLAIRMGSGVGELLGTGDDKLTIQGLAEGFGASLYVFGDGGDDEVVIETDLLLPGRDIEILAETITVNDGVTLSTRSIAGSDPLHDLSTGASGNIVFEGKTIAVRPDAMLLTHVDGNGDGVPDMSGLTPGSITLTAEDDWWSFFLPFLEFSIIDTKAEITLDGAVIRGGEMTISATTDSSNLFDDLSPGREGTIPEEIIGKLTGAVDSISEIGGFSISTAESLITIKEGTDIETSSLTLDADALSDAVVRTVGTALAVAYGQSDPTAKVVVEKGAVISTSGDLTLSALATSNLDINAKQSLLGPTRSNENVSVTIAVTSATIEATSKIAAGASVFVGGNLTVEADVERSHKTTSVAGAYEEGSVGIGVAVSLCTGNANALVDGFVDAQGDVNVRADYVTSNNDTSVQASVGSGWVADKIIKAKDLVGLSRLTGSLFNHKKPFFDARTQKAKPFALSTTFVWAGHTNNAMARIGDADPSALEFAPEAAVDAASFAIDLGLDHGLVTGQEVAYSSGGGESIGGLTDGETYHVVVANDGRVQLVDSRDGALQASPDVIQLEPAGATGDSHSLIEAAHVTSRTGEIEVAAYVEDAPQISAISVIDSLKIDEKNPSGNTKSNSLSVAILLGDFNNNARAFLGDYSTIDAARTIRIGAEAKVPYEIQWFNLDEWTNLLDKLNANLGIQNGFFTSWAQASAVGDKTAWAGSINVTSIDNTSQAYVGEHARINQDPALRSDDQHVTVEADSTIEAWHLSGIINILFFGTTAGKAGVGGSYLDVDYANTTTAEVQTGSRVWGESVLVRADSDTRNVSVAEAGGKSEGVAIDVAWASTKTDNTSVAQIDDGARVETGDGRIRLPRQFDPLFSEGKSFLIDFSPRFDPQQAVDDTENTIDLPSDHDLYDGQAVVYLNGDDTSIGGLTNRETYYVVTVDPSTVQLATTVGGPVIDLDPTVATGNGHALIPGFDPADTTISDGNVIELPFEHGFGYQFVIYSAGGGDPIGGLEDDGNYFVKPEGKNKLRVLSEEPWEGDFWAGIDLDPSAATGTGHCFVPRGLDGARQENVPLALDSNRDGRVSEADEGVIEAAVGYYETDLNLLVMAEDEATIFNFGGGFGAGGNVGIGGSVSINEIARNTNALIGNRELLLDDSDFDPATGVDSAGEIHLGYEHLFADGEAIVYSSGGEPAIGGLADGGTHYVGVVDADTIRLGKTAAEVGDAPSTYFGPSSVDEFESTIDLGYIHKYETGDPVRYASGGTDLGGLVDGTIYYVIVVDDQTIALASSLENAIEESGAVHIPLDPAIGSAAGHRVRLFPDPSLAYGAAHTVGVGFEAAGAIDPDGWIDLGRAHGLTAGQAVVYSNGGGDSIGGLAHGATYYVIVDEFRPHEVQLADSLEDAEAGVAIDLDPSLATGSAHTVGIGFRPAPVVDGPTDTIRFARHHALETGDVIVYHSGAGDSIGGLTDGTTYYAIVIDDVTIRLAATSEDAEGENPTALDLDPTVATGSEHRFREPDDGSGYVNAGGELKIAAVNAGSIAAPSLAGAFTSDNPAPPDGDPPPADDPPPQEEQPKESKETAKTAKQPSKWGIALAGDWSENLVSDTTQAFIDDTDVDAIDATLDAWNNTAITSVSGSVAIARLNGASAGIAGAVSRNQLDNQTRAFIDNATLSLSGDLAITAETAPKGPDWLGAHGITALSASGSGASKKTFLNIAGNVSLNDITNETHSFIQNSEVDTAGSARLTATDDSTIFTVAGALEYGGKAGVGVGWARNKIDNSTLSFVSDSYLNVTQQVELTAANTSDIESWSAAIALGGQYMAAALAVSLNTITNDTRAFIDGHMTGMGPSAVGAITLAANDTSKIKSIAGNVSLSASKAGFGLSWARNTVRNTTLAHMDDAMMASTNAVGLSVVSNATINSWAVGGAGVRGKGKTGKGVAVAGAGSWSDNLVEGSMGAYIDGGTVSGGTIGLSATDTSTITAVGGAVSLALAGGDGGSVALSVGASLAFNFVDNTIESYIRNASVASGGLVELSATSTATIEAWTIAGAGAAAHGKKGNLAISAAGSWADNDISNTTKAYIEGGTVSSGNGGTIGLSATDTSTIFAVGGALSLAGAGGEGGGVAATVGASMAFNRVDNTIESFIKDAMVTSDGMVDLSATSTATIEAWTIAGAGAGAGGKKGGVAISAAGSWADNDISNTTKAYIEGGTVSSGNGGTIGLSATDSSTIFAVGGSLSIAGAGGEGGGVAVTVGASMAFNRVDNTIESSIKNAMVTSDGMVDLTATSTATIEAWTIAGAGAGAGGSKGGVAISAAGCWADNDISNATKAYIEGGTVSSGNGGTIGLSATDTSTIFAVGGSLSIGGAGGEGGGVAVTVGASMAFNRVDNTIESYIRDAMVTSDGMVDLSASSTATIEAWTIAGAGAGAGGSKGGVAISAAGSWADNDISNTTKAYIEGGTVSSGNSGAIGLSAADTSTITAVGGAVSLALAGGGDGGVAVTVGASFAFNDVENILEAYIENATVISDGMVDLSAVSTATIEAWTIAGAGAAAGGSKGGVAISAAGSWAENEISNTTKAYIEGGTVSSGNDGTVGLSATDTSTIKAVGGSLALAGAGGEGGLAVSVGASFAFSETENTIQAYITGATVTSAGEVDVSAASTPSIWALTIGAAGAAAAGKSGSLAIAGAGSWTDNEIRNTVTAYIADGATVNAGGGVSVGAIETATNDLWAGGLAGAAGVGSAAVGASYVNNEIASRIEAYVEDAAVDALQGGVSLRAESDATQNSYVLGGAGAGTFALGGSVCDHDFNSTIDAHISNGAFVRASGDVLVDAVDSATINVWAGGIAGAGTAAIGASIINNDLENTITAYVEKAMVVSTAGGIALTANSDPFIETHVLGGAGAGTFALGGAYSESDIRNTVDTHVALGDESFDGSTAVNAMDNSIDLGYAHGLASGEALVYRNGGGDNVGGLEDGETYYIVTVPGSDTKISLAQSEAEALSASPIVIELDPYIATGSEHSLGRVFELADVDADPELVDSIVYAAPHGFTTGQAVIYSAGDGESIGGLSDGQVYYVIVIDEQTIQLAASEKVALSGGPTPIDLRPFEATGSAHSFGVLFDGSTDVEARSGMIRLDETHDLVTGQTVAYGSGGGTSIGGLSDCHTYYAVVVDPNTIMLAGSKADALAVTPSVLSLNPSVASGDPHHITGLGMEFEPSGDVAGDSIDLGITHRFTDGQAVLYRSGGGEAIAGLQDGARYYIVQVNGSDSAVRLAASRQDALADTPVTLSLDPLGATGDRHSLEAVAELVAKEDVSLMAKDMPSIETWAGGVAGAGTAAVGAAWAENGIGDRTLVRIGGAYIESSNGNVEIQADSTPSITSRVGGGAGAGTFALGGSYSDSDISGTTKASVGGGSSILSGADTTIGATENLTVNAIGGAFAIGGSAAVGASVTVSHVSSTTEACIEDDCGARGGTMLAAGGDVTIAADSTGTIDGKAIAGSGGLWVGLSGQGTVLEDSSKQTAFVGTGARIPEAGKVRVEATKTLDTFKASSAGLAAGALAVGASYSDAEVNGSTKAYIGEDAEVGQEDWGSVDALDVNASADLKATAETFALAGGIVGAALNFAYATIDPDIEARIDDSTIAVSDGVKVDAEATVAAKAETWGLSLGGLAVGVSVAESLAAPDVTARVAGQISADALSVTAARSYPADGYAAEASTTGSAGGLIGVDATESEARSEGAVSSSIADGSALTILDSVAITATGDTRQKADADSNVIGVVAAGGNEAYSDSDVSTEAVLGAEVAIAGGVAPGGPSLAVIASGTDDHFARAEAGAGGLGGFPDSTAGVEATSMTIARISGDSDIDNGIETRLDISSLELRADHTTKFNSQIETNAGGLLAGSGATIANVVTSTVESEVGNDVVIRAGELTIEALNRVRKETLYDDDNNEVDNITGTTGGLAGGASVDSSTTLNLTTLVTIGDRASLEVVGDPSAPGRFDLRTSNDILAKDRVSYSTGGAISGAGTYSTITAPIDVAKVEIGSGARLESIGAIDISARGAGDVSAKASAETYGLGTYAKAETVADLRPDNQIVIRGGGTIVRALGDLNLSTGTGVDFNRDQYTAYATTDTFSGSLIPLGGVDATATVLQHNTITVEAGALLETAGDAKLHAERLGLADVSAHAKGKSWVSAVFSADVSEGTATALSRGAVVIEGTVRTGIQRHRTLVLDQYDLQAGTIGNSVPSDIFYTVGIEQVKSNLEQALDNARENLRRYEDAGNTDLIEFYEGEIVRLTDALLAEGLLIEVEPGVFLPVAQLALTVTVEPVVAKAGVIDVRADELAGTGVLDAPGDASVEIINQTPAYLKILGITIPQENGGVWLNGEEVSAAGSLSDINAAINAENEFNAAWDNDRDHTGGPAYTAALADFWDITPRTLDEPTVDVINDLDVGVFADPIPWPDITILGTIENLNGLVNLETYSGGEGNVVIQAAILAKDQSVSAGGSVFIEGITSLAVAGEPGVNWKVLTGGDGTEAASLLQVNAYLAQTPTDVSMLGDRIVIDAEFININGIIQSGHADYDLLLGQQALSDINLIRALGMIGRVALPGFANGNLQVYYDTEENCLIVDELRARGGYVDLTGHIMNTRNGEIRVFGGYADVRVTNETPYDVVINRIDVSERGEGTLIIKDKAKSSGEVVHSTIYTKTAAGVTVTETGSPVRSGSDNETYHPDDGWRYGWSVGLETATRTVTTYATATWLGIDWAARDPDDVVDTYTENLTEPTLMPESIYYFKPDVPNNLPYDHFEDSVELDEPRTTTDHWTTSTWYGKKTYYTRDTVEEFDRTIDTHTIMADRPIAVSFIGHGAADVELSSSSSGRILLDGPIVNSTGTTTIDSATSIEQRDASAIVSGRRVVLMAGDDIGTGVAPFRINVAESEFASLKATSAGGSIYLEEISGNLPIDEIVAGAEEGVTLTARGSIVVGRAGAEADLDPTLNPGDRYEGRIEGASLTLRSAGGAIGEIGHPLTLESGASLTDQVLISARDDVVVQEESGDLRIAEVTSETGDIWIRTLNGDIVDANQEEERDERTYDELLHLWTDLQLTEATGRGAKIADTEASLAAFKTQEYQTYWRYRNAQPDPSVYDPGHEVTLSAQEEDYYRNVLGYDDAAIAALEAKRTAEYHTLHGTYGGEGDTYDPDFQYQLSVEESTALSDRIGVWTEEQLLYSFSAGLLKPISDTQTRIEAPNIVAEQGEITLLASGSVGRTSGQVTIDIPQDDLFQPTTEERVALAAAEREDVIYWGEAVAVMVDFAANGTITRTDGGSWLDDGFEQGSRIQVQGATANLTGAGNYFTISAISDAVLTVTADVVLEAEAGRDVTMTPEIQDPTEPDATVRSITVDQREDIDVEATGAIDSDATADLFLGSRLDMNLGAVLAGQTARIKTDSGIFSLGDPGIANVAGGDLVLEAADGPIGTALLPLLIDLFDAATLTARASGAIHIVELAGDMNVETVFAEAGGVYLGTEGLDGSIVDALDTDFANIAAGMVELTAAGGGIGEAGDYLDIDVGAAGNVTATAENNIRIAEASGDMNVRRIMSHLGDVDLLAAVSILDAADAVGALPGLPEADVIGNNIMLSALLGGIGMSGNDLDLDSAHSGPGKLVSSSVLNSYLIETIGDLYLDQVGTGDSATAFILAPERILNGNPDPLGSNVTSGRTRLFAGGDIGSEATPLRTAVGFLEGRSIAGDVWIVNTGSLTVGGLTEAEGLLAEGSVTLTSTSPMTLEKSIHVTGSGQNITLTATDDDDDAPGNEDHLMVKSGVRVYAEQGAVVLRAGDDLIVEAGASVEAATSIMLVADHGNVETAGSVITLGGLISAPVLGIYGGAGDDVITLDGSIEGSWLTIIEGAGGDDHITINSGGGPQFPLVVYGDWAGFGTGTAGADVIDASATLLGVMIDGGPGIDTIFGSQGGDHLAGGSGSDEIHGQAGADHIYGDSGFIVDPMTRATAISVAGAPGADLLDGGPGDDIVLGDYGLISQFAGTVRVLTTGSVQSIATVERYLGGADTLFGGAGADILIGGAYGDLIDGNEGADLILGDNGRLDRRTVDTSPRFRTLLGGLIYDMDDTPLIDRGVEFNDPQNGPSWSVFEIADLDHTLALQAAAGTNYGDDYIAGGADDDMIFGQLGDDTIQGDGSIASALDDTDPLLVGALRLATGSIAAALQWTPSFESDSDGDDYIEGNGGNDVIFGNLGQDDIIGGSSSLFSLITPEQRPDGTGVADPDLADVARRNDILFGGAGTRVDRNHLVDDGSAGSIILNERHARDADVIAGDNANIYRLVEIDGASGQTRYLEFNYDQTSPFEDRGGLRVIPRAVEHLDYYPGGPDYLGGPGYDPTQPHPALSDIGAVDEIHGESGDDAVYGMVGNDILYGDSEDDDLIGGWGHDWISGGTGGDGVLGDDGRIWTSRNSTMVGESLYGIAPLTMVDELIATSGNIQQAVINPDGALKKTVNLTPFKLGDPNMPQSVFFDPQHADDIIYGGWGDDFLHGGDGDDAISGAEALLDNGATLWFDSKGMPDAARTDGVIVPTSFSAPFNPGDALAFEAFRGEEFALYDEFAPRTRIVLDDGVTMFDFFLNFNAGEGPGDLANDGSDAIFGDMGHDWAVGGSGRDHLYGGRGNDLLNADDNLDTNGGLNDAPDGPEPAYEDTAFGGAGRDVLIANTGGDRLIDWAGEFNSYIVPFAPFGLFTISRALPPHLMEYLYDLSAADGADPTRGADDKGITDDPRNGEPFGELGLVIQKDADWHEQTGAPDDPQPGNIPGGPRDILRGATFNDGSMQAFAPDTGVFSVENGALRVAAESIGGDAAAVFHVADALPTYYELAATIATDKPIAGWKANAYIIFDYYGPTDFKFAGLNASIDKMQMGHRTAEGWIVDVQTPMQVRPNQFYNMLLAVNGTTATLLVDGTELFQHVYQPRVIDGWSYSLNNGMVGFGSDNSRGIFDNIVVQQLPPEVTFENVEDFTDGAANIYTGERTGSWQITGDRYVAIPAPGDTRAVNLADLGLGQGLPAASMLEVDATLSSVGLAGLVFDAYSVHDFKFVAIDTAANEIIIGHHTPRGGWAEDSVTSRVLDPALDHDLDLTLKGTTVGVWIDGQAVAGHVFNSVVVDGSFGMLTGPAGASFDTIEMRTDAPGAEGIEIGGESLTSLGGGITGGLGGGLPVGFSPELSGSTTSLTGDMSGIGAASAGDASGMAATLSNTNGGRQFRLLDWVTGGTRFDPVRVHEADSPTNDPARSTAPRLNLDAFERDPDREDDRLTLGLGDDWLVVRGPRRGLLDPS